MNMGEAVQVLTSATCKAWVGESDIVYSVAGDFREFRIEAQRHSRKVQRVTSVGCGAGSAAQSITCGIGSWGLTKERKRKREKERLGEPALAWKERRITYANTIGCLNTNLGTEPVERIHLKVLQNNDPVIANYSLGYFLIFLRETLDSTPACQRSKSKKQTVRTSHRKSSNESVPPGIVILYLIDGRWLLLQH